MAEHVLEVIMPVAVVAAAFGRSRIANTTPIAIVARDASAFAKRAMVARAAASRGADTAKHTQALADLAGRYGAELCAPFDPNGMSIGLVFASGVHTSGFRNILFVC